TATRGADTTNCIASWAAIRTTATRGVRAGMRTCRTRIGPTRPCRLKPIYKAGAPPFRAASSGFQETFSMRLSGKTALVTAAGQGIGFASVIQMAREGATVYATDVNPKLLVNYSGIGNVHPRILDVLDDAAVAKMIDELPALDVLFNCAGYVHHGTALDCTPKDWDFSFNLNVRAMYIAIKSALPKMLDKHQKTGSWASIINM